MDSRVRRGRTGRPRFPVEAGGTLPLPEGEVVEVDGRWILRLFED